MMTLENPDGRILMTASHLLERQGYTYLAKVLKEWGIKLLNSGPSTEKQPLRLSDLL